ncbi:MAG: hypothetical protein WBA74_21920, partial [Cyclobacteriaceae bacterium]
MKKSYTLLWILLTIFLLSAFVINRFALSIRNNPCFVAQVVEDDLHPVLDKMDEVVSSFSYTSYDFRRLEEDQEFIDRFHLFYYEKKVLKYWTDFERNIPYHLLPKQDQFTYFEYKGSNFIVRREAIDEDREVFAILTLYQHFPFENQYLQSGFNEDIFPGQNFELYQSKRENQVNYHGK